MNWREIKIKLKKLALAISGATREEFPASLANLEDYIYKQVEEHDATLKLLEEFKATTRELLKEHERLPDGISAFISATLEQKANELIEQAEALLGEKKLDDNETT